MQCSFKDDFKLTFFVCPICTHSPNLNLTCALDVITVRGQRCLVIPKNVAATGHTQLPLAISETWQHKATVVTHRETKHSGNSISMLGACQQLSALCFYGRQIGSQNGVVKGANCLSAGLVCISCETRDAQWDGLTQTAWRVLRCRDERNARTPLVMSAVAIWHFLWRRMLFIILLMRQKLKDPLKLKTC